MYNIYRTSNSSVTRPSGGSSEGTGSSSSGAAKQRKQRPHPSKISEDDTTDPTVGDESVSSSPSIGFSLPFDGTIFSSNGRNGINYESVYGEVNAGDFLDNGAFGDIFKCQKGGKQYALKITSPSVLDRKHIDFQHANYDDVEEFCQEIKVLIRLQDRRHRCNRNMLQLAEYFWDGREICMVTELLGTNLRKWIREQPRFTEEMARSVSKTILKAIDFMHSRGVVHRDLKHANILMPLDCSSPTCYDKLKIVDFGLAHVLETPDETLKDYCGSPGYIAPEVLSKEPYRVEVDMFSFGCLMFRMLSSQSPWPSTDPKEVNKLTRELRYRVDEERWYGVTQQAKKLIFRLLTYREDRLTAQQALSDPWFHSIEDSVLVSDARPSRDGFSRAIASPNQLSVTPERTEIVQGSFYFYHADDSIRSALTNLIEQRGYSGEIVHNGSQEGIYLKEPVSVVTLPEYVTNLPCYTEWECRILFEKLAKRIQTFHHTGVAHRHLHVENVLVDSPPAQRYETTASDAIVSIRGLQYALLVDQPLTGRVGKGIAWYAFTAPEIDSEFIHDARVDLWSLGAILYTMLCGIPPFRGEGGGLKVNKHRGIVPFDVVAPSDDAQDLVMQLLQVRPEDRWSIDDVMEHEWMRSPDYELQSRDLSVTQILMTDTLLTEAA